MNHEPVCVKCKREMRPETNGVGVLDMANFGPCQVWDADKWKCPVCGIEIVVGFAQGPIARHHDKEFFERVVDGYRKCGLLIESRRFAQLVSVGVSTFEIWSEGYRATGDSGGAICHGVSEGKDFKEACDNFAKVNEGFARYYASETMSYWACRLFSSEAEARESFG